MAKTGKKIEVRGREYFVNAVPAEFQNKPEWFLAQHKVNVVFSKHFTEDVYPAAELRSWLDDKRQPSEAQVRRALIWSYDSYGDYSIKSGGGAVADNIFISHLKITIADSRTGDDKDVVILKKYSGNFKDVLITIDEVQQLENATESDAVKKVRRAHLLPSLLREIIRAEKGIFSIGTGKGDWTAEQIRLMKRQCARDYSRAEVEGVLERLAEYAAIIENHNLNGGTGRAFLVYVGAAIFAESPALPDNHFLPPAPTRTAVLPAANLRSVSSGGQHQPCLPF